jgi:hypothetical protein
MRAILALTIAVLVCGVFANEGEGQVEAEIVSETEAEATTQAEAESELAVPTLPGRGMGCLPVRSKRDYRSRAWHKPRQIMAYRGQCVSESTCGGDRAVHGRCAGMGTVCCLNTGVTNPFVNKSPAGTVLRAGASACANQGGVCGSVADCNGRNGRTQNGLCPGPSSVVCCFSGSTPQPPVGTSMTQLIRIPAGINAGLNFPSSSYLISKIGRPGCPLTTSCFNCNCAINNGVINRNKVTLAVTPNVRITGLKPFVEAIQRAFAAMNAAGGQAQIAYQQVKTAGGLCCRPIKRSDGSAGGSWSNHSWGFAVDFYFGSNIDPRGDGKTQFGLSLMAPFFAKENLYWAAGYAGSSEDAMHFEASTKAIDGWTAAGLLK